MNKTSRFLIFVYRLLLHLYPALFREEYGAEMAAVFGLHLQNTSKNSGILLLGLRELRDLPAGIIQAHIHHKKEIADRIEKRFTFQSGSWQEVLLACMPLLLMGFIPGLFSLIPISPPENIPAAVVLLSLLTICLIGLGAIGLLAKLPLWAASYPIIPITLFIFTGLSLLNHFDAVLIPLEWGFFAFISIFQGLFLLLQVSAVLLLLKIATRFKTFSGFLKNVKNDPSTLSFMLYGTAIVIVLVQYEDVVMGSPFLFLSILSLGLGVWGYLSSNKKKVKITSLISGSTMACLFALLSNILLFRYGNQTVLFRVFFSLFLNWASIQILILVPLILPLNKGLKFSGEAHAF